MNCADTCGTAADNLSMRRSTPDERRRHAQHRDVAAQGSTDNVADMILELRNRDPTACISQIATCATRNHDILAGLNMLDYILNSHEILSMYNAHMNTRAITNVFLASAAIGYLYHGTIDGFQLFARKYVLDATFSGFNEMLVALSENVRVATLRQYNLIMEYLMYLLVDHRTENLVGDYFGIWLHFGPHAMMRLYSHRFRSVDEINHEILAMDKFDSFMHCAFNPLVMTQLVETSWYLLTDRDIMNIILNNNEVCARQACEIAVRNGGINLSDNDIWRCTWRCTQEPWRIRILWVSLAPGNKSREILMKIASSSRVTKNDASFVCANN